jgi:hypothetical protein
MKIDFSYVMKDFKGEDINQPQPLTLAEVCAQALLGNFEEDKTASAEAKIARFRLAHKLFVKNDAGETVPAGELDLSIEDATLIKKFVNKAYGVIIVGQVDEIIK